MRFFEYRHVVSLEDTNLVGNVYFVNHLRWQGRSREAFLRRYCPEILADLAGGLALVTVRCGCTYLDELLAFEEVALRMRIGELHSYRTLMLFDYHRVRDGEAGELVARGEQEVACMRRTDSGIEPERFPDGLWRALQAYNPPTAGLRSVPSPGGVGRKRRLEGDASPPRFG